jgi:hypothetical protein
VRELIDHGRRVAADWERPETVPGGASVSADMAAIFHDLDLRQIPAAANSDIKARSVLGTSRVPRYRRIAMLTVPLMAVGLAGAALLDRPVNMPAPDRATSPVPAAPVAFKAYAAQVEPAKPMPVALSERAEAAHPLHAARSIRHASLIKGVSRQRGVHGCASSYDRSHHCVMAMEAAADRELRAAYRAAIRAGAHRRDLVAFRDAWAEARRRGSHRPMYLVASYTVMSRQLRGLANDARSYRY